jgi:hypothetical protein
MYAQEISKKNFLHINLIRFQIHHLDTSSSRPNIKNLDEHTAVYVLARKVPTKTLQKAQKLLTHAVRHMRTLYSRF